MAGAPYQRRGGSTASDEAAGALIGWCAFLVKLSVAALLFSYGYYIWGIAGGYLARYPDPRILANLRLMGTILVVSGGVGTAALIIVTFDEVAWSVLAGLVGGGLLFGTPALLASYAKGAQTQSVQIVGHYSALAGEIILGLVILRVLWEVVFYIRVGSRRMPVTPEEKEAEKLKRKGAATAGVWARCWDMPYCQEAVREHCPAYKARKTCWKFGYGCMCHPKLIEALIRMSTQGATAVEKARQAEYVRSDLEADTVLKPDQRTIPCTKCPIFTEHQRQKFRIVNPIIALGTIAALIAAYKPVMALYRVFVDGLARIAARLTYGTQVDPRAWFAYLDSPTVRIFFYVIVGTLVLAYLLKAVEYLILTKKWV